MGSLSVYTLKDFAGSMIGVLGFTLVLGFPGYAAGWLLNVAEFRGRALSDRLCWAVLLSLSCVTYLSVMISKYGSLRLTCALLLGASLAGVWLLGRDVIVTWRSRRPGASVGPAVWISCGLILWSAFVTVELIDFGWAGKLYMSATVYDHSVRNAFVQAVVRTGVPPHNPLYWTVSGTGASAFGHAASMRYYYFWYVLCGAVVKLVGISARQALIASCAWSGIAFVCMICMYCRDFLGGDEATVRRRSWIGVALLAVTGLDLLAIIGQRMTGKALEPDMEWWSATEVTSWIDSVLWVPHHLAALLCCLFAFLLLWMTPRMLPTQRWVCGGIMAVAFASSFGLSTYVAVAFAMVMVAWVVWAVLTKRILLNGLLLFAGVAVSAGLLLLPYVLELRADGSNAVDGSGKTHVLAFGVREMIHVTNLVPYETLRRIFHGHVRLGGRVMALVLMVPGYIAELGVYCAVLWLALWRSRNARDLSEPEKHCLFFTVAGLVVCTFIQSDVIATNDFGIRASLIPQFFLLMLAVTLSGDMLRGLRRSVRFVMLSMLVIGVLSSAYQVVMLRIYYPHAEARVRSQMADLSAEAMALRRVEKELETLTAKDAVVQFNIDQPDKSFIDAHLLNTPRQVGNGDKECVYAFGGDARACPAILSGVGRLYLNPTYSRVIGSDDSSAAVSPQSAYEICDSLKIDYLVATRWDKVWSDRQAWPWTLPVLIADPDVRVVGCRSAG